MKKTLNQWLVTMGVVLVCGCSDPTAELALGEEYQSAGEAGDIENIIQLLSNELTHQYIDKGERVLRDTHPKSNGCVHGIFSANDDIDETYRVHWRNT